MDQRMMSSNWTLKELIKPIWCLRLETAWILERSMRWVTPAPEAETRHLLL